MLNHWNEFERTWAALEALTGGPALRPRAFGRFVEAAERGGPRLDIYETEDGYLVTADLPGFDKADLEVKFEGDRLTLAAKRQATPPEGYQVVMEERGALEFSRTVAFPAKVDGSRIEAVLKDGVLELRIPKHPEAQPRQIPINVG